MFSIISRTLVGKRRLSYPSTAPADWAAFWRVLYTVTMMIMIQWYRHIYKCKTQSNTQHKCMYRCRRKQANSPLFRYKPFINYLTSVLRHEKRDNSLKSFVSYYANTTPNVRHILWSFRIPIHLRWSGPEKRNRMPQRSKPLTTRLHGRELNSLCPNGRSSIVCLHGP